MGVFLQPGWQMGSIFSQLRQCAGTPPSLITGWVFWPLFAHALRVHFLSAHWF